MNRTVCEKLAPVQIHSCTPYSQHYFPSSIQPHLGLNIEVHLSFVWNTLSLCASLNEQNRTHRQRNLNMSLHKTELHTYIFHIHLCRCCNFLIKFILQAYRMESIKFYRIDISIIKERSTCYRKKFRLISMFNVLINYSILLLLCFFYLFIGKIWISIITLIYICGNWK